MTTWRDVPAWCLGENNEFGTCFFAMIANWHLLNTTLAGDPQTMMDGEIEYADSVMTGFNPMNAASDKGEALVTGFDYLMASGWPAVPTLRPPSWHEVTDADVADALSRYGCLCCWVMLPQDENGWDLSDAALAAGMRGTGPHAVLMVESGADGIWLITWGEARRVSRAWWAAYGRQQFALVHPGRGEQTLVV